MSNGFGNSDRLPDPAPNSTVPLATPSFTGTKGTRIVPKRRFQKGTFAKRNGHWVGMWRVDVLQPDGAIKREQRSISQDCSARIRASHIKDVKSAL
jgi:hypothetical protein